jgi:hypothetical protein
MAHGTIPKRATWSDSLDALYAAIESGSFEVAEAVPNGTCRWLVRGTDGTRRHVTASTDEVIDVVGILRVPKHCRPLRFDPEMDCRG